MRWGLVGVGGLVGVAGCLWLGCSPGRAQTPVALRTEPHPAVVQPVLPAPPSPPAGDRLDGRATYYADAFHGRETASGEPFDMHAMTAAHRTLPFGTVARVTNLYNGRSVTVRINDRGPFAGAERILDVSYEAAVRLGMLDSGVVPVRIAIVRRGNNRRWRPPPPAADAAAADAGRASESAPPEAPTPAPPAPASPAQSPVAAPG